MALAALIFIGMIIVGLVMIVRSPGTLSVEQVPRGIAAFGLISFGAVGLFALGVGALIAASITTLRDLL